MSEMVMIWILLVHYPVHDEQDGEQEKEKNKYRKELAEKEDKIEMLTVG